MRADHMISLMSPEIGRILLLVGLVIAGIGLLAVLGLRLPLGQLPGDIRIETDRATIYIPLMTMLVVSIALSIMLTVLGRLR